MDWACSTAERCGPGGQARRLSIARGFLSHLRATVPETEIPGPGLLARGVRPLPHIYSDAEIQALIAAAQKLDDRIAISHSRTVTGIADGVASANVL